MRRLKFILTLGMFVVLIGLIIGGIIWAEKSEPITFQERLVSQVAEDAKLLSAGEYDDEAKARTQAFVAEYPECEFYSAALGPFSNKLAAENIREQAVSANEAAHTYANFTTEIVVSKTGLYYVLVVGANCTEKEAS